VSPALSNVAQPAAASAQQLVLESRSGSVVTLTMNRPERLNALDIPLAEALRDALVRAGDDSSVRAIILTGAGRAFCAGGDLTVLHEARQRNAGEELRRLVVAGNEIVLAIAQLAKPVLAVVNGPAAGAGMNVALACDLRIASERASFGQNFAKIGLFPDFGGTYLLPRLVGPALAAEMFFTGEMITAQQAADMGIVNRVVQHDLLAEDGAVMAAKLAAAPPLAVRAVKQTLFGARLDELRRALANEVERQVECFRSEDCAEGLSAFFGKRAPNFKGR
jgi:2-(1,2-epoxy-1,2-dihydrophenyl)acetyl-CoA isomerase